MFLENWLKEQGYLDDKGCINFSDRFIAKMANTSRQGNWPQKVCDTIKHVGLLPEKDWLWSDNFDWNGYYAEIPQVLKDKALLFLKYFSFQYEWLSTQPVIASYAPIAVNLKQAPLQLITATCPPWNTSEIIVACPNAPTHATMAFKQEEDLEEALYDYDSYPPYRKRLAKDYPIYDIMKAFVDVITYEITTEMCRFAWVIREDLQIAFTAKNKFYQDTDERYSLYDWVRDYGIFEMPEVFIEGKMDWSTINTSNYPDYILIEVPVKIPAKKKDWWQLILDYFADLFK
jgi:hypothetical protein